MCNPTVDKAKSLGLTPRWYQHKNDTVCILLAADGTIVARGVATLSVFDEPNKKVGKDKSLGRAIKAYANGANDEPIIAFRYRSEFMPDTTRQEHQIAKSTTIIVR